ncbi:glycosyltransferase [Hyphomonas sp. FCG-A18]|uniref:glycosyltransferase family 4 protein n=1 Tax=Hyphomonas sp. FCG-A18 TaxID=3080019 RepID=UPI002B31304F|nr:glycosyltransferase [Hyphomonas sp. FCG-A18]
MNIKTVVIDDGDRRITETGYGALTREIILSLWQYSPFDIYFTPQETYETYPDDLRNIDILKTIPEMEAEEADLVFRVGVPGSPFKYTKPCLFYTQNALGDIPEKWRRFMRRAGGIIVPGEFDKVVFDRYFPLVYTCPQGVDIDAFKPKNEWRSEGSEDFSFLFVGSYSYRKGADLLPKVFKRAFSDGAPVHLHLQCFSGLEKTRITDFFNSFRYLPNNIGVSGFSGHRSIQWMNRIYNQHDAILTFSRGEGWCMPLHEALLCEKPVIAPNSTAMGEYLPNSGVEKIAVHEKRIEDITGEFASSVTNTYSTPDNILWEIDIDDAVRKVRRVYDHQEEYKSAAKKGAKFIRETYNRKNMAKRLTEIIHDFEKRQLSNA